MTASLYPFQNLELLEQLQSADRRAQKAEEARLETESRLLSAENTQGCYKVAAKGRYSQTMMQVFQSKISSLESQMATLEFERKSLLSVIQELRPPGEMMPPRQNGIASVESGAVFDTPDSTLRSQPTQIASSQTHAKS